MKTTLEELQGRLEHGPKSFSPDQLKTLADLLLKKETQELRRHALERKIKNMPNEPKLSSRSIVEVLKPRANAKQKAVVELTQAIHQTRTSTNTPKETLLPSFDREIKDVVKLTEDLTKLNNTYLHEKDKYNDIITDLVNDLARDSKNFLKQKQELLDDLVAKAADYESKVKDVTKRYTKRSVKLTKNDMNTTPKSTHKPLKLARQLTQSSEGANTRKAISSSSKTKKQLKENDLTEEHGMFENMKMKNLSKMLKNIAHLNNTKEEDIPEKRAQAHKNENSAEDKNKKDMKQSPPQENCQTDSDCCEG